MTNVQYVTDDQGTRTSVLVPIEDWNRLVRYIEDLDAVERIEQSVRLSMKEVRLMEAGKIQPGSTKEFLDAL
ncbi:hypothetical protein [Neolewinella antarctica]|uniref:Prevent-host-death protein n=1 Tax=Neolewinella antarctica TaxID=442734 RepID=A0ABX0XFU8_9BACT|nr:hypothetical protein [Neolewinella antarctica]